MLQMLKGQHLVFHIFYSFRCIGRVVRVLQIRGIHEVS